MTTQDDGATFCDRCGVDLGTGSIRQCAIVSVLDSNTFRVLNLHLCLTGIEGGDGCASRILTKKAIAHFVDEVEPKGEMLTLREVESE